MAGKNTAIVTGASQGIGAAVVQAFLDRGYNVVATSRSISKARLRAVTASRARRRRHRPGSYCRQGCTNCDRQVRLDRPSRQQRGHLLSQTFHGLHASTIFVASFPPTSKGLSSSPNSQSSKCCHRGRAEA